MKKLLMATDLSARSDRALERAVTLAREHGAALAIVHVVDSALPASLAEAQSQAARETIQGHVDSLAGADGLRLSIEIVRGRAHVEVLAMSEAGDAETIILGMHREDTFRDMFRGTTAERILRTSRIPVLVVRDRVGGPYRQIVVGVDFSVYSRRAVAFAVAFAPGGAFHLVHAYDVPFRGFLFGDDTSRDVSEEHRMRFQQTVETEMASFLATVETKPAKIERVMEQGVAQEVICRHVRELRSDLLVVGTHGRTGVAQTVLGSVAEALLRNPPCDVLAVKAW